MERTSLSSLSLEDVDSLLGSFYYMTGFTSVAKLREPHNHWDSASKGRELGLGLGSGVRVRVSIRTNRDRQR